jgi:hypothetical protein
MSNIIFQNSIGDFKCRNHFPLSEQLQRLLWLSSFRQSPSTNPFTLLKNYCIINIKSRIQISDFYYLQVDDFKALERLLLKRWRSPGGVQAKRIGN